MTDIITELSDGVLRVELNRPEKKNAMTGAMYTALAEILENADKDEAVRVVLWHGAGDSFTAGNDIADFQQHPPAASGSPQGHLTDALIAFSKPIVAAVHGAAVGGGTTMLTHCDFVYAAETARFQTPFINLALTPEFGSSYSIPASVGYHRAAELFMLGEPEAIVFETAASTAQKLAAKPGGALRTHKRLLKRASLGPVRDAVQAEGQEFAERARSAEAKEAFSAFFEHRAPNFTNLAPALERSPA
jgi:enoyl-CoA hydratase/carnithine racemase